jgi:sodium-dependent dicarboxylate transporter 2/3/5
MFPNAPEIGFGQWMVFAFPLSVFMLLVVWIILYFIFFSKIKPVGALPSDFFKIHYQKLQKYSFEEKIVTAGFFLFVFLLLFRTDLNIGSFTLPGWTNILSHPEYIHDGTIAIAISIALFIIPTKVKQNNRILDWNTAKQLPWQIIILFGGGFVLAKGFVHSGLSVLIGEMIRNSVFGNQVFNILLVTGIMVFLTEVTSNTATTQIILPVLGGITIIAGINPLVFMIPAAIAASMTFILSVTTPPNAIVFGSGKLTIFDMSKVGLFLNIISIIFITLFMFLLGGFIFDFSL